jgi:hypothetical protein
VHALEAGDDRDLAVLLEALDQLGAVHFQDTRRCMRIVGQYRKLPPLPGPRIDTHSFKDNSEQAGRDLLAGCDYGVVFPRVVQHRGLPAPFD